MISKISKVFLIPFFLLLILPEEHLLAQSRKIDSLVSTLKREKEDSNKVKTLNSLAYSLYTSNPDSTVLLALQADTLSSKIHWIQGQISAKTTAGIGLCVSGNYEKALEYTMKALKLNEGAKENKNLTISLMSTIGNIYYYQGNYPYALDFFTKELNLAEEIKNIPYQASALGNLGIVYKEEGDYPKSLDVILKALKAAEKIGNKSLISSDNANIGLIYLDESNYTEALNYLSISLRIDSALGDKLGYAKCLDNIGLIYSKKGDNYNALKSHTKALGIFEEMDYKGGQATSLSDIAADYGNIKDYAKSEQFFIKALDLAEKIGDKSRSANAYMNLGEIYIRLGKFKESENSLKKAIYIDSSINHLEELSNTENIISNLFDTTKRYELALYWNKRANALKDTLFNFNRDKAMTRKELTYKFEKQSDSTKALQEKKDAIAEQEKKKQVVIRNSFIGGFLLMLALAFFIFRGYKQKQNDNLIITRQKREVERQKILVEQQKELVEEKNKDILDSISYAKRLQDAILPPLHLIKKYLPESFVLYKPKDIVAGDFYWMERIGESILIAAADCTGHGVPGALVSVVCSNALNRAVNEFHVTEPGKVLDKARELVLETFEKNEGNIQDGMDISLASICTTGDGAKIQWAGAYNPLIYVKENQIMELLPDKQPIGKTDRPTPFTLQTINVNKGDSLYLFTDGFADQFGGPKGKKFKYRQMQELILSNAKKSMAEQKMLLEYTLEDWMGNLEQVDDILVIGIKI